MHFLKFADLAEEPRCGTLAAPADVHKLEMTGPLQTVWNGNYIGQAGDFIVAEIGVQPGTRLTQEYFERQLATFNRDLKYLGPAQSSESALRDLEARSTKSLRVGRPRSQAV
jgi:hypothetical protein